jgi:nucleotide-binding universal stress UspA family protein
MFTRIFVPLDGSKRAEQALPVAARLARASGGTVVLARVVNVDPKLSPYFVLTPTGAPGLTIEILNAAQDYVAKVARSDVLAGLAPVTVILTGVTAHELLVEVNKQKADLVVMTSHGHTGPHRWALGSVAQYLARHAHVPVLVLREDHPFVSQMDVTDRPFRVLAPLDGSARAEAVLTELGELLSNLRVAGGIDIHLVCVLDSSELALAHVEETIAVEGANAYLKRVAELMQAEYPHGQTTVTWSVVAQRDVADVVIRLAETGVANTATHVLERFDLVAMATHGRTGLARWAVGSVTERVSSNIRLPLFIVRPTDIVQQQLPADVREHVVTAEPSQR